MAIRLWLCKQILWSESLQEDCAVGWWTLTAKVLQSCPQDIGIWLSEYGVALDLPMLPIFEESLRPQLLTLGWQGVQEQHDGRFSCWKRERFKDWNWMIEYPLYWIMFFLPKSLPPQHHDFKDHLKKKQQQFFLGPFQSLVWMHVNAARMAVSVTWAALLAAASVVELQPILAAVSRQLQHSPHWSGQLWLKTGGLGRAGWMSNTELSLCSTQKGRLRSSANLLFAAKAPRWALMIWTGDGLDLTALCLMLCEITLFAIKQSNYIHRFKYSTSLRINSFQRMCVNIWWKFSNSDAQSTIRWSVCRKAFLDRQWLPK